MKFGDIQLKQDAISGRQYIEFARKYTNYHRSWKPRIYSTETDRDPVQLYKDYVARRPEESKLADFPFYLTCIPAAGIVSDIWYYSKPVGKNYIGKLMSMAANECGLERKTSYSVLKSGVMTQNEDDEET